MGVKKVLKSRPPPGGVPPSETRYPKTLEVAAPQGEAPKVPPRKVKRRGKKAQALFARL